MINDNDPSAGRIATRRALSDWAKDKPKHVQDLAWVIRGQLRELGKSPDSDAMRDIVGANLKRLAEATRAPSQHA